MRVRIAPLYILIGAIVVAAISLAYYGYRFADELARRGEQTIVNTNRYLAQGVADSVESVVVNSGRTLFDLVDPRNLREFGRRWSETARLSSVIQSVLILDDHFRIVPDGFYSRAGAEAGEFRQLFESDILPALDLPTLKLEEHRHLHREFNGRYYLLSFIARSFGGKTYYIVLEGDLSYLVAETFPDVFQRLGKDTLYKVVDEHGNVVFGQPFSSVPERYLVSVPFLWTWKLILSPREAPTLQKKERTRRAFDGVFIAISAITLFVGLGVLTLAIRTERRANALKSDFIANVSHELKTPLSLIRMFGELLATGRTKGPESAKEYAEIITRESERLSRLIDNVLDFARIERGRVAYEFAMGDLAEVLSRGLDVYRYRLDREGMKLSVHIEDDLPQVRMDENAMTLVLLNLVDNAVKYAAEGKELLVTLSKRPDRVVLAVQDRGPGIRLDEQERVFDRFYRSRDVRGRPVRGSGIGLSLVKHIAEAHGGGVTLHSKEGEGSTFTVWIPLSNEPDVTDRAQSAA